MAAATAVVQVNVVVDSIIIFIVFLDMVLEFAFSLRFIYYGTTVPSMPEIQMETAQRTSRRVSKKIIFLPTFWFVALCPRNGIAEKG